MQQNKDIPGVNEGVNDPVNGHGTTDIALSSGLREN
jgi:hypothetical protein